MKKSKRIQETMDALGLGKMYSCVVVDKSPSYMGMLKEVESVLTYGEIDKDTFKQLLKKRSEQSNKNRYEWKDDDLNAFAD